MAKTDRRRRPPIHTADDIHPPDQRGKRASPETLTRALQNASSDMQSADLVRNEHDLAIEKKSYVLYNPEALRDQDARLRSASDTVASTTEAIRAAQQYQIERKVQPRLAAKNRRNDILNRQIEKLLSAFPNPKDMLAELEKLSREPASGIIGGSGAGIEWMDRHGNKKRASLPAIAKRMKNLREKISVI